MKREASVFIVLRNSIYRLLQNPRSGDLSSVLAKNNVFTKRALSQVMKHNCLSSKIPLETLLDIMVDEGRLAIVHGGPYDVGRVKKAYKTTDLFHEDYLANLEEKNLSSWMKAIEAAFSSIEGSKPSKAQIKAKLLFLLGNLV